MNVAESSLQQLAGIPILTTGPQFHFQDLPTSNGIFFILKRNLQILMLIPCTFLQEIPNFHIGLQKSLLVNYRGGGAVDKGCVYISS